MANIVKPIICGVDVSQETLDIARSDILVERIPNTAPAIREWLRTLPVGTRIAIEATGSYHETLLEHGLEAGYEVFIVNGKQLHHYREAVGPRAKTDTHDAQLLRRYLCHEYRHLTPVKPLNNQHKRLWCLLKRRAMLVKVRTQLRASMKGDPEVQALSEGVVKELERTIRQVENLMRSVVKTLGLERDLQHCRSVPGIGPVNALALVACFHRGTFQRVDQFIAYLGLDVRVRDSGKMRGKRKLTKRGESEIRRLLYNAAMTFARIPQYRPLFESMLNRGMSSTAAHVAMSRKLARIAFALMKKDEDYLCPE